MGRHRYLSGYGRDFHTHGRTWNRVIGETAMKFNHTSVLLQETIDGLNIRPDGVYVDGTLGGGGHSYEIASRLSDRGQLIGIDQDEAAITAAGERLKEFGDRVIIVRSNYRNTKSILQSLQIEKIDGMMLDLGVSSYQLDTEERGFSYRYDAPLDMRMDKRQTLTARDIVKNEQTAIHPLCHNKFISENLSEFGGNDQSAFCIYCMVVLTHKHMHSPVSLKIYHFAPL